MSSEVFQGDAPLERRAVSTEPADRNWSAIGAGLAAAIALAGMYGVAVWAVVVLVQALA